MLAGKRALLGARAQTGGGADLFWSPPPETASAVVPLPSKEKEKQDPSHWHRGARQAAPKEQEKDQELEAWLIACQRVRGSDATARFDQGKVSAAELAYVVRLCAPGVRRPQEVFSPLLASLFATLLGPAWYTTVHPADNLPGCAVSADRFERWRTDLRVRTATLANFRWLFDRLARLVPHPVSTQVSPPLHISRYRLAAHEWHRLLQTAHDFHWPALFDTTLALANAHAPWSPLERALFLLVW